MWLVCQAMCSVVKSDSAERTCIKRDYYTSIVCQFLERVIFPTIGPADQDSDLNQKNSHLIFGLQKGTYTFWIFDLKGNN